MLLGDALELRQGPLREALAAARPFFAEAGAALGADGEIVLVPGNHDHALVAPWLERRHRDGAPPPLGLAETAAWAPSDAVAALAEAAAPARLTLAYPGVWLRDDVYAMHGHYLDRHITVPTLERLSAGAMGRIVGALPERRRDARTTTSARSRRYTPGRPRSRSTPTTTTTGTHGVSVRAWRMLSGNGHRPLRRRALVALFPLTIAAVNRAGLGPVRADISGAELGARGRARDGRGGRPARDRRRARAVRPHAPRRPAPRRRPGRVDDARAACACTTAAAGSTSGSSSRPTPYESPYWPGTAIRVDASRPAASAARARAGCRAAAPSSTEPWREADGVACHAVADLQVEHAGGVALVLDQRVGAGVLDGDLDAVGASRCPLPDSTAHTPPAS